MSFQIDALYDGGVLKPLQPLVLPDQSLVTLTVSAASPSLVDVSTNEMSAQQAALDELRKIVDARPQTQNNDGWSVRQHDELLYGKP